MGRPTTRLHVSGYRFLTRRMSHALVRGDLRMIDDPLRAQSIALAAGIVLAAVALAGCAVLALLRPQPGLADAAIVAERGTGALYVRIGDTLHPVPNLTSARLIVGSAEEPRTVDPAALASAARGPLVGIPGAPATVAPPLVASEAAWTVCDTEVATTVLVGPGPAGALAADAAVLVHPRSEGPATTYLLHGGRRYAVDLRDIAVVRALHLDGVRPRPVSRTLLDALPENPPLTAPSVPGAGKPGALAGHPVGAVVTVSRAGAGEYYVVLADGVQRIGELTADLIRFTVPQRGRDIPTVAADAVAAAGITDFLPVDTHPARVTVADPRTLCAHWTTDGAGAVHTAVLDGADMLRDASGIVELAQADGAGPAVDAVRIPHGRSVHVRPVSVTGGGGDAQPRYLVSGLGVLYGLAGDDTAQRLGLRAPPLPAPWPVLARLPRGPELSRAAASVVRDVVEPAPRPAR
ncbi:type VII secretion protein EccB [Mycobacterium sp. PS03-16]|uniref:type VII secretion protein EccB n=1 Tax=Mycobacterium sp. PS03-16 TaxID=2559611 RepID=UPI001073D1A8|nr:type VII secretion protein EccB [Mycobacterium sp. PS03-16]TFV54846.1 type VII secretion protein EccB [Mycobacterium sp. PS03-16]